MMASIEDTFRATLSNFKKRLTPKEQDDFSFSTLEDVRKEIARIQSEQGSQKMMMNMTRLQSFLEAMDQFGKVIEVFLNASEFVAFVWGPLKFILQVWNIPKSLHFQKNSFRSCGIPIKKTWLHPVLKGHRLFLTLSCISEHEMTQFLTHVTVELTAYVTLGSEYMG
jgi:hypothetical protein